MMAFSTFRDALAAGGLALALASGVGCHKPDELTTRMPQGLENFRSEASLDLTGDYKPDIYFRWSATKGRTAYFIVDFFLPPESEKEGWAVSHPVYFALTPKRRGFDVRVVEDMGAYQKEFGFQSATRTYTHSCSDKGAVELVLSNDLRRIYDDVMKQKNW